MLENFVYSKKPNRIKGEVLDERGKVFGRLTAIRIVEKAKGGSKWEFKCECGNTKVININQVKRGKTNSCGCLNRESASKRMKGKFKTHGACKEHWYSNYSSMIQRTVNEEYNYRNEMTYGKDFIQGKLIEESWIEDPWEFYKEIGEKPSKKHSIDRIDNNRGYVKGNVKWSNASEQSFNRRQMGDLPNITIQPKGTNRRARDAYLVTVGKEYLGTRFTLEEATELRDEYRKRKGLPEVINRID